MKPWGAQCTIYQSPNSRYSSKPESHIRQQLKLYQKQMTTKTAVLSRRSPHHPVLGNHLANQPLHQLVPTLQPTLPHYLQPKQQMSLLIALICLQIMIQSLPRTNAKAALLPTYPLAPPPHPLRSRKARSAPSDHPHFGSTNLILQQPTEPFRVRTLRSLRHPSRKSSPPISPPSPPPLILSRSPPRATFGSRVALQNVITPT